MTSPASFRSTANNPIDDGWLLRIGFLEVRDRGVSIRVDSAVWRHLWITFGPQLTLDHSLGYPPRSEQQATRLEHNLAARSHFTRHSGNSLTG